MFSPKFAWNDYFTGSPATTLHSGQHSSRQTFSVASVYVLNCLFNKCIISSGNGGALSCTSSTYLFIEFSSFFSCKTNSGDGGAIYFYTSNINKCVLYSVCGNDCIATSYGPFARININNGGMNYVNYTSIVRCMNDISNACETVCFEWGEIYCPSINMSINKCLRQSGIYSHPSTTSSLLYSTFSDNSAMESVCIWFGNGNAKYDIKCCNIIRNIQASLSTNGIIFTRGNTMIEDSCILENTATYIFYQSSSSYAITLSNCTVDLISHYNSFTIQKTVTKSFIHALNHMTTQNCHSEYDSAGTLTALPYVSHSTKKLFHCTCHYQARISIFVSLIWVFMITFIHPNPSGN
jgi:hypothetical protein